MPSKLCESSKIFIFKKISKHENPLLESSCKNHKKFMPEPNQTRICPVLTCSHQSYLPVFPTLEHAISSVTKITQKCLYLSGLCKKKNSPWKHTASEDNLQPSEPDIDSQGKFSSYSLSSSALMTSSPQQSSVNINCHPYAHSCCRYLIFSLIFYARFHMRFAPFKRRRYPKKSTMPDQGLF